jgi:hypothetical protein
VSKMKYSLFVALVVVMALVMVASTAPALAAEPSAPSAEQLIDQLQNTKTSQEGYALWNSLTPAQQNAVRALVEPKNLNITVTENKPLSINAIGVSPITSGKGSYTIQLSSKDPFGYLWTWDVTVITSNNGQIITSASGPFCVGRVYRYNWQYHGADTLAFFGPGNSYFYAYASGDFSYGIPTPWGWIIIGHAYPWVKLTFYGTGSMTKSYGY